MTEPVDNPRRCPACGHVADMDEFDVAGADFCHVFCPKCGKEVEAKAVARTELFAETRP